MNNIQDIENKFLRISEKFFPNAFFKLNGRSGLKVYVEMSEMNSNLRGSPYYYQGDLRFIHWTSISNLMSILNSREIRFYNLFNSNDKNEFLIAAEVVNLSSELINLYKENYFTFSFCTVNDINNSDLWNNYGVGYKGVAIEFSILNDPSSWIDYMISNVYYSLPESLINLKEELKNLKNEFPEVEFDLDLGKIVGFYKGNKFDNENEIRISIFYPHTNIEKDWKFCKTDFKISEGYNRITNYFCLPLWIKDDSPFVQSENPEFDRRSGLSDNFFNSKPKIKIENIYFGHNCGISPDEYLLLRSKLIEVIKLNFGYPLDLPINQF